MKKIIGLVLIVILTSCGDESKISFEGEGFNDNKKVNGVESSKSLISDTVSHIKGERYFSEKLGFNLIVPQGCSVVSSELTQNLKKEIGETLGADKYSRDLLNQVVANPKSLLIHKKDAFEKNIFLQSVPKMPVSEGMLDRIASAFPMMASKFDFIKSMENIHKEVVEGNSYSAMFFKNKIVMNNEPPRIVEVFFVDLGLSEGVSITFNNIGIEPKAFLNEITK